MLVNLKGMPSWVTHKTSDPQWELGSLAIVHDRVLRYVKATAAVTAGEVVVVNAPAQVSDITGFSNVSVRVRASTRTLRIAFRP